jgi:hypothetical protein
MAAREQKTSLELIAAPAIEKRIFVSASAKSAKYRLPDGRQLQRRVGLAWTERGRPAAGYGVHEANDKGLAAALGSVYLTLDSGEPQAAPQNTSQGVDVLTGVLRENRIIAVSRPGAREAGVRRCA